MRERLLLGSDSTGLSGRSGAARFGLNQLFAASVGKDRNGSIFPVPIRGSFGQSRLQQALAEQFQLLRTLQQQASPDEILRGEVGAQFQ